MCPIVSLLRFKFVIGHRKSTNLCPNLISGRLFKTPLVNFAKFYGFEMNYFRRWPRSETKTENSTIYVNAFLEKNKYSRIEIRDENFGTMPTHSRETCLDFRDHDRDRKFWSGKQIWLRDTESPYFEYVFS